MNEAIGRVVVDSDVQIGKSLDVPHRYPVVHPYLQCLANRRHPDRRNSEVGQNRVVGRRRHGQIRVGQVGKSDLEVKVLTTQS